MMTNKRFLVYLTMMIIMFVLIEQSHEMYLDCQARCMLSSRRERNRETLRLCREECDLMDLLDQEDAREGKHHGYRRYD